MVHDVLYTQAEFRFIASVCILLLSVPAAAQDAGNKVRDKNYVEVTRWVSEVIGSGGKVDEKLGEFDTYSEASNLSLEWSESHPKDLRLTHEREVTVRIYPDGPSKPQPDTPIPNAIKKPDLPFVDIPPSKKGAQGTEKNPNSVDGKTARGKAGEWELSFEFRKDGNFVATDPSANGMVLAKGDWSQTGTAVSIQTEKYLYMGTVSGATIEGKRITRGAGGRTVESWKVTFTSANAEPTTPKEAKLADTIWESLAEPGEGNTFRFEGGGRLIWKNRKFGNEVVYSYRQVGNKLLTRFDKRPERESTIEGDEIKGYLNMKRK